MNWVLNFIYATLLTLLSPVILWRNLRHGRYRQGWKQRLLGCLPTFSADDRVVWFHAVSVGEVLQLQKLVEAYREKAGHGRQILITTSTDTGFALATERFPGCETSWFPLDFSWAVSKALSRVNPEMVVMVELELWPNFLKACSTRNIRTSLVNARMSDRSFRGYMRIQRLISPLLQQFSIVATQTQEYAERLILLGTQPNATKVTGSIKFDRVMTDRHNPATQQLRKLFNIRQGDVVLIAGSTQSPEEEFALDAWQTLQPSHPGLRLILVPRHRERFEDVAALVSSRGLPLLRRTNTATGQFEGLQPVILLDTIGELGACWGLADIAFVGGSFGSRGGQNMLEPAAYGAAVLFGPNTRNFKDIVSRLLQAGGAKQLQTPEEFRPEVARLLDNPDLRNQRGQSGQEFVITQQGAIDRTVTLLITREKSESSHPIRDAA